MIKSIRDRILIALKDAGFVKEKRLDDLLKRTKHKNGANLVNMLIAEDIVSDKDLLIVLSSELNIPPIDMTRIIPDKRIMTLLPEKIMRRYSVMILSKIGNVITLVTSDPTDILAMDDITSITGCVVEIALATRRDIEQAIRAFYEGDEDITDIIGEEDSDVEMIEKGDGIDLADMTKESTAAPIVKMVDLIISESIKKRASDIHIEPQERTLRVRYRIDGEMHTVFDLPKKNQNAIIARIKIMSNLDITETRVPQDGRFRIRMDDREIDYRVSVLPISFGNKIVLRALDKSNLSVGLDSLGFLPGPLADFHEALSRPFGIILVTGPTGSGKSTTLYSIISEMNVPERNIITIEDPVEYQVEGITQIAAQPDIGLDFADGLRALLRQSPDVILVGEIRDHETADIAIKASLTGQMVLSTLHTNDAVGAITRLVNMGVEPFLIASSLVMACAQRLLRRICPSCKAEIQVPPEVLEKIRKDFPEARDVKKFYKGAGCSACNNTGYKGRLGTLETFLIDNEIRRMINERRSEEEIREYLEGKKIRTLRDNAMIKFIKGETTLEEVLRVT